jgi:2,3-bisphosphoglycerate-independent phosphoglycerate mutase
VEAITATDAAVGTIYNATREHGYVLLITADHGNAEQMRDPITGNPHTAHTTNPVPFFMAGDGLKFKDPKAPMGDKEGKEGQEEEAEEDAPAICDVAPTVLDIMVRFFFLLCRCSPEF